MIKRATGRIPWRSPITIGVILAVTALVAGVVLFSKAQIMSALSPGTSFDIQLEANHGLRPYSSQVKIAGIPVGVVTSVEQQSDNTGTVTVKIDNDAADQLGSEPSANIRPTTLLGGNYYVDLVSGGDPVTFAGSIPVERTTLPVELDDITHSLQPDALTGLRSSIPRLNQTLGEGGSDALDRLVADAPDTLDPAADVLRSVQGTQPSKDLPNVVRGLESASLVLSEQQGQLDSIVTDLRGTVGVLDARSQDIASAVRDLPTALASTDAGIQRLDGTLAKLRDVAEPLRDVAEPLNIALEHTDPVLVKARPVVNDLRDLLVDARPLVQELVPTAEGATDILRDVQGPVLERANGPIKKRILSPFKGTGPYKNGGSDKPLYQELAYMAANLDRASKTTDGNGAMIAFQPGIGPGSLGGLPISLEQLFQNLAKLEAPR